MPEKDKGLNQMEPMLKDRIYRSTKLGAAVDVARKYGVDINVVLSGTDFEPSQLNSRKHLISVHQLLIALKNLSRLRVNATIAYEIGQEIHVSAYGMYGFAILCSSDFRETMKFAQKYHTLATPVAHIRFSEDPGVEGWFIKPISHPLIDPEMHIFLINMQMGILTSLHRDIMGPEFSPRLIKVDYPKRAYSQLPLCSSGNLIHSAGTNFFSVDPEWLNRSPTFGNDLSFQHIEALCKTELADIANRQGYSNRVRTMLLQNMAAPPNIEKIAESMRISSRTLRRYLTTENTSYREILDETRSDLAVRYVQDSSLTNEEMAYSLGFADVSSFRRAFSRWTEQTTTELRSRSKTKES